MSTFTERAKLSEFQFQFPFPPYCDPFHSHSMIADQRWAASPSPLLLQTAFIDSSSVICTLLSLLATSASSRLQSKLSSINGTSTCLRVSAGTAARSTAPRRTSSFSICHTGVVCSYCTGLCESTILVLLLVTSLIVSLESDPSIRAFIRKRVVDHQLCRPLRRLTGCARVRRIASL